MAVFSNRQADQPHSTRLLTRHHPQIAHPDQVVGRHRQDELIVQLLATDKPALAQTTDGLGPAEALLNSSMRLRKR